ncbi:MAG: Cys-Gln thioester bond-forming surface protein [Clostridia bacterium]
MKLRKGTMFILILFLAITITSLFGNVQASQGNLVLNLKMLRNSGYGYKLGNTNKNIWKIYEVGGNADDTIYCLKGGPGFGSGDIATAGAPVATTYTRYFDLKDPDNIPQTYQTALPSVTGSNYKALLWILDNCYVPAKINASTQAQQEAEEYKNDLLDRVKAYAIEEGDPNINSSFDFSCLTDDDIDAVQQLAVWHYTNDSGDPYHVETYFEFYINSISGTDANYDALSTYTGGLDRANACQALFNYLVETPQKSGFQYQPIKSDDNTKPVQFLKTTQPTVDTVNNRKIIGPYQLEQLKSIEYNINLTVTDGNGSNITDVILLNNSKQPVESTTTLKDLIGQQFYISIPESTDTSSIKLEISGNYYKTTTTYWSVENPTTNDQPVVILKKEKKTYTDEIANDYATPEFDLALRKFITSINGVAPTNTRVPDVNTQTLINGTFDRNGQLEYTATYTHPKDALKVNTGDKVVYTIRIYNEGEIDGTATQITDYLPSGLEFVSTSESTINQTYGWSNPSGDGKTIVTSYLANELITAFDGQNLQYKDVQIECKVIAKVGDANIDLKNIAEITAHKDKNGNTTVIDRDSTPENVVTNNYGTTSQEDDDDFENLVLQIFDLSLRKFITSINGVSPTNTRVPNVNTQTLINGTFDRNGQLEHTATYTHPKDALIVKTGDKVIYTIRIYNEGEVDGTATQITDYLPSGLECVPASESTINQTYGWSNPSGDGKTIVTSYLANELITAFNGQNLQYKDVQIECKVVAEAGDTNINLKNIAEITAHKDKNGNTTIVDRDSVPGNVVTNNYGTTSQEDDDDFEILVLNKQEKKYFDLSLRKFIISVSNNKGTKNYNRAPKVEVTPLINGETTATYNHSKTPVNVTNGDIVTYTIRVYNEGQLDGYVTEITDHLPPQLEFIVDDELNARYGWSVVSKDGRTVTTDITSPKTASSANRDAIYESRTNETDKVLLKAFNGSTLDYIDVQIRCKVKQNINLYEKITNIAEITGFTDSQGNNITDRDSKESNVVLPTDESLPTYKDTEIERGDQYIPGQQDDDDFEKLVLQIFDLSLRKFITGVNEKEITSRAPVFNKTENNEYEYIHPKDPVDVANGNTVIYTLRIFNEGNVAGYASEVKDNLPEGLEFLPEHPVNTAFKWKMYKEDGTETTDVKEASYIKTQYLSKDNESVEGNNLIDAFNPETMTMPDYKDLKVAFKVTEPNTSDRIIINTAEITDDTDKEGDPIDDVDSEPDNNDPDEDDIDIEKIKVKYFDLSLKKWVTASIVTYDGKTTVTETGHTGDENPEPPAKVEIRGSRISKTTVKFRFNIKVTNEGEIAGYVKELIDYVPEGLKFVAEDNPMWREEDGKVLTDQLKDVLIEPGQSETVEIVLTWINNKNNMGLKTNWAEIYEDDNEYDSPDIDSTPGNDVKGEDDIDDAPVILSVVTGSAPTYITLALASIAILASGVILIKKFVI